MNDLIRPTLYEAHHEIRPVVIVAANAPRIKADVVGPVCETGDYLALDREMSDAEARRSPGGQLRAAPMARFRRVPTTAVCWSRKCW